MSPVLSPYPLYELKRAREDFFTRWHKALYRDPLVRSIHELHRRFPPSIRMKNCAEYPFTSENEILEMPALPAFCKLTSFRGSLETDPSVPDGFLTEDSDKQIKANYAVVQSKPHSSILICDVCSFRHVDRTEALDHLQSTRHSSCSLYMLKYVKDYAKHRGSSTSFLLCDPRVLYNGSLSFMDWLSDKVAVVCPSCYIVFPDKLMCSYHHQSHHDGCYTKYSHGSVLDIRDLNVYGDFSCDRCDRSFENREEYLKHWSDTDCCSPFHPGRPTIKGPRSVQIIQVHCTLCRMQFCRMAPGLPQVAQTSKNISASRKRKFSHTSSDDFYSTGFSESTLADCVNALGHRSVNHAHTHLPSWGGKQLSCRLLVRVIEVDKSISKTLPVDLDQSDRTSVSLSIIECKRLLTFLVPSRSNYPSLFRRTKTQLKRLLELAAVLNPAPL